MDNSYIDDRIIERINISAMYINSSLDNRILTFVKEKLGNKCIENGYVNKEDIKIIGRTNGKLDVSHFTGDIMFDVECAVKLFNPAEGTVLYCQVVNKNKMGIVAEIANVEHSPIRILLAREHHIGNEDFQVLDIDNIIYVEIIAKMYEYNDTQIQAIGVMSSKEEILKQIPDFVAKKVSSSRSPMTPESTPDVCDYPIVPDASSVPASASASAAPASAPAPASSTPASSTPTAPTPELAAALAATPVPYSAVSPSYEPYFAVSPSVSPTYVPDAISPLPSYVKGVKGHSVISPAGKFAVR